VQLNKWYHVAGVFDGSYLYIYVNGTLDATPAEGAYQPYTIDLYIARFDTYYTRCLVSEVHMFNRALTDEEIVDIYNNRVYTTPAYPGKALIRAYASQEPSVSIGEEKSKFILISVKNEKTKESITAYKIIYYEISEQGSF
jgi:hypothetical protein